MKQALILFTRIPVPGKTKTRLMPYFSPKQCAKLHTCFLKDISDQCRKVKADCFVCYAPENGDVKELQDILGKQKEYFPQTGESLGQRMYHSLEYVLGLGYDVCLLMGTDIPEVSSPDLEKAFQVLKEKDAVFGRTADGGYYLVGMKRPIPEAFGLKQYGHSHVFEDTLKELSDAGINVGFTTKHQDMDTPEDLRCYRQRMRQDKRLQHSHTGRYLAANVKISVIIPVYNEAKTIEAMKKQLYPYRSQCEILFVDGGSTDGTPKMVGPDFKLLLSEKGRANQMNLGAEKSHGDILLFLHCDSELPPGPLEEICRVMKDHSAGCFGIAFHSRNFFMFTCRVISNHRIKDRKVMFGDQGIFIDRELFFQAGKFPVIPVMEDYQFSLTLKEMGVRLGMAKRRIYTSDRRFPKGTIPKLKLMWKMNRLRKMYRDQVPIEKIDRLYRDVR